MDAPQLIVTDVDGTLITDMERVTPRTRAALHAAHEAGSRVVLATGRPTRWVREIVEQLPEKPICLCSNGAVAYDAARDEVLWSRTLKPETLRHVYSAAADALADFGELTVAAERAKGPDIFVCCPSYHDEWITGVTRVSLDDVLRRSALKLLLRSHDLDSQQMYDLIAPHVDPAVAHLTFSMPEGLIEVTAPGVTKASGLQWLAEYLGVERSQTVAFGDMPNDIEMLQWAQWGVAMGNADPRVQAVADEVAPPNTDDGLAVVLERWFPAA